MDGRAVPCYTPSAIYPMQAPAPPVPLIRNPPSNEEYRHFLLWRAQQNKQPDQHVQQREEPVPPPQEPSLAYEQQYPDDQKQQQPLLPSPSHGQNLRRVAPPKGVPSQHVPNDINPLEPMILTKSSIREAHSGRLLFTMKIDSVPDSFSSRSLLTVSRSINGPQAGTIGFHSLSAANVDISVNGCSTKLMEDELVSTRWCFRPSSSLSPKKVTRSGERWWWSEGKESNTLLLATRKTHGHILARLRGNVLVFDPPPPPPPILNEIVVTAVAMMEITNRSAEDAEVAGEVLDAVAGA